MIDETRELIVKFIHRVIEDYDTEHSEALTPDRTMKYLMTLSGSMAWLADQIGQFDKQEAKEWMSIREKSGTNAEADRMWSATETGLLQIEYRALLKACEIVVQACKKKMRLFEAESEGRY